MFSLSTTHSTNLRFSSPTDCLLTLSDAHHKIKDVQALYFHKTTKQISQHPSPASPIHTNASQGSFLITDYIHLPESTSLMSINYSQNTRSLTLSSLSRIPLQQLDRLPGATESYGIQPSSPS